MLQRATTQDALLRARRRFQAAERIDMGAIAEELGVNRVTLYRWVGSRDRLLVEVLWSLAEATLAREDGRVGATGATGAERIVQVVTRFIDDCLTNAGMQRLLGEEGERTMRLLTRRDKGFQPRLIDAIHRMLSEETQAGRLDLPVDLREVAYVVVRLIESYVYLDIITGEEPDARRAEPVLRLLLR
jgi:AcrR family transcriptional regulator